MTKADRILKDVERTAKSEFLPIVGPHKGQILLDVIRDVKPKHLLEIGTLIGYSTILMGKELGSDTHLVTIEIHADEARRAKENIRRAAIQPNVEMLVGNATEILPKLEEKFDVVFIDASKTEYLTYLRLVEDKLHKGSVVIADNAGASANRMRDYLEYVRSSGKYNSRYVPVGRDGLEISIKL